MHFLYLMRLYIVYSKIYLFLLVFPFVVLTGCPDRSRSKPASDRELTPGLDAGPTGAVMRHARCSRVRSLPEWQRAGLSLGSLRFVAEGPVLRPESAHPRQSGIKTTEKNITLPRLLLGVVADTHVDSPENRRHLERARDRLTDAGAQAIVVLGGLDPTYEGTRELLNSLGGKRPILALPGDRESESGFSAAVENLASMARPDAGFVDLTLVRALLLPQATLMGVPGYHLPHHHLAGVQGCGYDDRDLRELARLARLLPEPRLLVAHGPPRSARIDLGYGREHLGDPMLRRLIVAGGFRFGLFAHLHESGGQAETLDGRPVPPGVFSDSLLLNIGSSDATPQEDLDGRFHTGQAALFEISSGRARFRILPLDDSPQGRPN